MTNRRTARTYKMGPPTPGCQVAKFSTSAAPTCGKLAWQACNAPSAQMFLEALIPHRPARFSGTRAAQSPRTCRTPNGVCAQLGCRLDAQRPQRHCQQQSQQEQEGQKGHEGEQEGHRGATVRGPLNLAHGQVEEHHAPDEAE